MVKKVKFDARNLAILAALGFAWSKLGIGAAVKDIMPQGGGVQTPPAPSCSPGEVPRFFLYQKTINGRSYGPGWACLPVNISRL